MSWKVILLIPVVKKIHIRLSPGPLLKRRSSGGKGGRGDANARSCADGVHLRDTSIGLSTCFFTPAVLSVKLNVHVWKLAQPRRSFHLNPAKTQRQLEMDVK